MGSNTPELLAAEGPGWYCYKPPPNFAFEVPSVRMAAAITRLEPPPPEVWREWRATRAADVAPRWEQDQPPAVLATLTDAPVCAKPDLRWKWLYGSAGCTNDVAAKGWVSLVPKPGTGGRYVARRQGYSVQISTAVIEGLPPVRSILLPGTADGLTAFPSSVRETPPGRTASGGPNLAPGEP